MSCLNYNKLLVRSKRFIKDATRVHGVWCGVVDAQVTNSVCACFKLREGGGVAAVTRTAHLLSVVVCGEVAPDSMRSVLCGVHA